MPTHMRHIFLLLLLSLLALPATAAPVPAASPSVSAATVPDASASGPSSPSSPDTLAPVFPLFPAWFTTPDRAPFRGPSLSAVAFLNPPMPLSPRNQHRALIPVAAGFGAELQFDKSNALRLHYGYVRADYPRTKNESLARNFNRHSINLDYLWNLTNHYYGYDPARSWEFLAVAGVSYGWAFPHDLYGRLYEGLQKAPSQHYLQGQLGFQIRKTLSPHLSAFLEPNYYVAQSNYDFYDNGSDLDDGLAFKAGIIYRLAGPLRQTPWFDHLYSLNSTLNSKLSTLNSKLSTLNSKLSTLNSPLSTLNSFFVQNLLGLNFSNIKYVAQDNYRLSNYHYSFAFGQWLSPAYGYRLGLVDRQILHDGNSIPAKEIKDRRVYRQSYLRMEALFNLPAFWDEVSIGRFGLDFSAGVEIGNNRVYQRRRTPRQTTYTTDHGIFPGITSALQLKYYLNSNTALVGEGRCGFFDRRAFVFTPSFGIEYFSSSFQRFRSQHAPSVSSASLPAKRLFFEAAAGFNKHSNQMESNIQVAPMAEFAVGMHLNHYISLRLKEHLTYHRQKYMLKSIYRVSNFHSQLALDYMFDLTNYWMGVDPDRRFTLRPFLGPVYSARLLTKSPKLDALHRFGFNFGVQHAIHVNPDFAFTVEPRYLALVNDFNHWSLSFGAAYTVPSASSYRPSAADAKPHNYYLQSAAGLQFMNAFRTIAPGEHYSLDLTFGRSVLPNISLQGSLFYQNFYESYILHTQDHIYGFRPEIVADVLNMMWPEANTQGYALTAQVGFDMAASRKHNEHYGPTVATQFRRRFGNSRLWWFAQCRMQARVVTSNKSGMLLSAGLHYNL